MADADLVRVAQPLPRLERDDPLLAHEASYFAASARMRELLAQVGLPMAIGHRTKRKPNFFQRI
jgi:hypothetical protein